MIEPTNNKINFVKVKTVHFNEARRITVVVFSDGTKTFAKCGPNDHFDKEIGFSLAIARRVYGSRSKLLKRIERSSYIPADPATVPTSAPIWPFKEYLGSVGLDTKEAAGLAGLSYATINRICLGYHPNSVTFRKVCEALKLDDKQRAVLRSKLNKHQL